MVKPLLLFTFFVWAMLTVAAQNQTLPECVDSHMTAALEYHSFARYKSISRGERKSYACSLITQCSVDRLNRLEKQTKAWQGAVSAAVYVPSAPAGDILQHMNIIDKFLEKLRDDPDYSGKLTVSVMFGHETSPELWNCTDETAPGFALYPVNNLRNLALAAATTGGTSITSEPEYIFYLDGDFTPSVGLSDWVDKQATMRGNGTLHQMTQDGDLFIVPAFESTAPIPATPTRSLQYLMEGIQNDQIRQFHLQRYKYGHNMTDYPRWMNLSQVLTIDAANHAFSPYPVRYTPGAEPYFIMARSHFVPYDERFRGYGMNKCVNLQWLADNGHKFYVLPGHFVVEDKHDNSVMSKRAHSLSKLLMTAYRAVRAERHLGRMPLISQNTAELLRAVGYEKVATEDPVAHAAYLRSIIEE